jgi:hypothetical protein
MTAANGEENDVAKALAKIGADRDFEAVAKQVNELLPLVSEGNRTAKLELRRILAEKPDIWLRIGDLGSQADLSLMRIIAGENEIVKEAIQRTQEKMQRELKRAEATPLERLLIDRVISCWLALSYNEAIYVQQMKELSWESIEYHQKRINHAHRRYLSAIRTLATVRRLVLPTVQVNLGNQQINVAK